MSPPTLIASGLSFIICFDIFYCIYIQSFLSTLILHTVTVSDIVIVNHLWIFMHQCDVVWFLVGAWYLLFWISGPLSVTGYSIDSCTSHPSVPVTSSILSVFLHVSVVDIDQLKLIMMLVGTPGPELLMKISSESVSAIPSSFVLFICFFLFFCIAHPPCCLCVALALYFTTWCQCYYLFNCTCFALNTLLLSHLSTVLWFLLLSSMYYDFFQSHADNFYVTVKTLVPNWTTVFVIIWI